jgi:hypothetical protein
MERKIRQLPKKNIDVELSTIAAVVPLEPHGYFRREAGSAAGLARPLCPPPDRASRRPTGIFPIDFFARQKNDTQIYDRKKYHNTDTVAIEKYL